MRLLSYPAGRPDTFFEIPGCVTELADYAFCPCRYLKGVKIESLVATIPVNAFFECEALEYFTTSDNNSFWTNGGVLFGRDEEGRTVLLSYPGGNGETEYEVPDGVEKIGAYAFFNRRTLERVSLPGSLTEIGTGAFRSSGLTELVVPESVRMIGSGAFEDCGLLESVSIPAGAAVGEGAFRNCENLKTVYYTGTSAGWEAIRRNSGIEAEDVRLFSADGYDETLWVRVSEPEAVPVGKF